MRGLFSPAGSVFDMRQRSLHMSRSGLFVPPGAFLQSISNGVFNGDFETAPPFVAATSTHARWIDGTSSGSATNDAFGWQFRVNAGTGHSAQFDSVEKFAGTNSLKIVSPPGSSTFLSRGSPFSSSDLKVYGYPVISGNSYTVTCRIKTTVIAGDSRGAYVRLAQRDETGASLGSHDTPPIKTTTEWTYYTITVTAAANARFFTIEPTVNCQQSPSTLDMVSWFDSVAVFPTLNSLQFNGSNSHIKVPTNPTYSSLTDFTYEGWINKNPNNYGASIFCNHFNFGLNKGFNIMTYNASGKARVQVFFGGDGNASLANGQLPLGRFAHVAVTQAASTNKIYINGTLLKTTTVTPPAYDTNGLFIGVEVSNNFFGGLMSGINLYNRALTDTEVVQRASKGAAITTGLIGSWPFNDGVGTIARDTSPTAAHGTITNPKFVLSTP